MTLLLSLLENIGSIREATGTYWSKQEGIGVQGSTPEPPGVWRRTWKHKGSIKEATGAYWSKQEGIGVHQSLLEYAGGHGSI